MNQKNWLAISFLYLAWGSSYLAIHYLVESVPPLLAAGSRNFLAGLILLAVGVFQQKKVKLPSFNECCWIGLAGFLMLTLGNGCLTIAVKWVPSGYASLFPALIPIWLVVLQYIFDHKTPTILTLLGCCLGVIGVGFLLNQKQFTLQGYEAYFFQGVMLLMVAAFAWSAGVMVAIKKQFDYPITIIAGIQMLVGGGILLLLSYFYNEWTSFSIAAIKPAAYFSFMYLLIFASLLGFSIFNWVSQRASPTLVATYNFVNPLIAIMLGILLANEPFSSQLLYATFFIIGAVILITINNNKALN